MVVQVVGYKLAGTTIFPGFLPSSRLSSHCRSFLFPSRIDFRFGLYFVPW